MEGIAHLDSLYFNRIAIKSGAIAGGIYYDKDRQAARAQAKRFTNFKGPSTWDHSLNRAYPVVSHTHYR